MADRHGPRRADPGPGGGRVGRGGEVAAGDVVAALARLREPEREVAILRLLLGHSLDHTAHLSGYSHRAAMELQLAACLALHELTGGPSPGDAALSGPPSAEELERRLGLEAAGPSGSDPVLTGALTAASSLRRAAPGHVADPPIELVQRLRHELDTSISPGVRWMGGGLGWGRWVAPAAPTTGIVVVLASQAFGGSGQPTACAGPGCPGPTTRVMAAGTRSSVGTPLTTSEKSSTTSSTLAADPVVAPSSAAPRTSAATVPPSTRPPTTAPPTTAAPRPTTTTAPTTTAATTTAAPTTTTVAPAWF